MTTAERDAMVSDLLSLASGGDILISCNWSPPLSSAATHLRLVEESRRLRAESHRIDPAHEAPAWAEGEGVKA